MISFNPDGSIKLPARMLKQDQENNAIFASKPSFRIIRHQISTITPLTCELSIEASSHLNPNIIEQSFNEAKGNFKNDSTLTLSKSFDAHVVRIVSGFNRCTWCNNFITHLSDRANARIIRTDKCNNKHRNLE